MSSPLPDGLVVRHVESDADLEAIRRLSASVFGEERVGGLVLAIANGNPYFKRSQYLFIEDRSTGAVVSSLCLIPRTWSIGGIPVKVAELGIVATDPAYRRRGLFRALHREFEAVARADGYTLAALMGVPYVYVSVGYSYAIPMDAGLTLGAAETGPAVEEDPFRDKSRRFRVRPAVAEDIPSLIPLWEEWNKDYDVHVLREPAVWLHQLRDLYENLGWGGWQVIEEIGPGPAPGEAGGRLAGYFGLVVEPGRTALTEVVAPERDVVLEAIRAASAKALENGTPRLELVLPPGSAEAAIAIGLGARVERQYAWQVKILDPAGLFGTLAPLFDKRLAASAWRGLSGEMVIGFCRGSLVFDWRRGRLVSVREEGPDYPAGPPPTPPRVRVARVPPGVLNILPFGYRSLDEILAERPDVGLLPSAGPLLSTLFPKQRAWVEV